MHEIRCGKCGGTFTISPMAPESILCPHCRVELSNPYMQTPQPVIPIEESTWTEMAMGTAGIMLLGIIAIIGLLSLSTTPIIFMGLVVIAVVIGIAWPWKMGTPVTDSGPVDPTPTAVEQYVLPYQSPRKQIPTRPRAGPFILGFFIAIAVAAGAFVAMALTADSRSDTHFLVITGIVAAYIGIIMGSMALGQRTSWAGVGRGVAVGVALGLIAIVPCAGCYMLTFH
ncbi:MAG TPA: hypothetical protein VG722_13020 [Tepidisphaeraceae bacterium]|nr:hypothetical protein [Tepidisphaeraceae bacterium]